MNVTGEKPEGTMIQNGACIYCGQIYQLKTSGKCTDEQLDAWATQKCGCTNARLERIKEETAEKAKNNIEKLFREEYPEMADIMRISVDMLADDKIAGITVDAGKGIKGKMTITSKGKIKVEKTVSKKTCLEE